MENEKVISEDIEKVSITESDGVVEGKKTSDKWQKFKKSKSKNLVLAAMFTAFIVIGSFTTIEIGPIPFTLQAPVILITGLLLGPTWGFVSVLTYIALGLIGVPVFSSKGGAGFMYVFKPSFGYIIGFLISVVVIGLISKIKAKNKKTQYAYMLLANLVGTFIIYTIGIIYMYLIMRFHLAKEVTASWLFKYGLWLFLPKELVFCVLTPFLAIRLKEHM